MSEIPYHQAVDYMDELMLISPLIKKSLSIIFAVSYFPKGRATEDRI